MTVKEVSKEKLRAALNWLRGFLEAMMGAQAYDEALGIRRYFLAA